MDEGVRIKGRQPENELLVAGGEGGGCSAGLGGRGSEGLGSLG